ncbi:MAG: DUF1003 domain-containing protein [Patescibacteria group bacterium]|nr:DUF1003 domain-containing protein [Patescibacteria group bacterium]MDD5715268.1 DUF1003 domain-containing protein [Patescibacteria group bacterium]
MPKHPRHVFEEKLSRSDRVAIAIAQFTGRMVFVWIHVGLFIAWIIFNVVTHDRAWDPYPFIFLTFVVSLEAIFLSTFVLIAQNREAQRSEIREQLDYEVNIKAEKEIQEIKEMLQKLLNGNK